MISAKLQRYTRARKDPAMALLIEMERIKSELYTELKAEIRNEIRGRDGEEGYTPVKGKDYFTESEIHTIIKYVESRIRVPENGKDADEENIIKSVLGKIKQPDNGSTPTPGVDYPTHEQIQALIYTEIGSLFALKPKNNKGITREEVDQLVGKIQNKVDFKEQAAEIARALETLKKNDRLDYNALKNLPDLSKKGEQHTLHRGGGGAATYYYDLSSLTDGVTKVFTIPTNSRLVWVGGTDAPGGQYRQGTDYTGSGTTTLTLTSEVAAPTTGATLHLIYVV